MTIKRWRKGRGFWPTTMESGCNYMCINKGQSIRPAGLFWVREPGGLLALHFEALAIDR